MLFETRQEAGRILATHLRTFQGARDTVVVALPRGGVPVAAEVARALDLPLDIFFVKKIPAPHNEEVGIGAVSENGLIQVDPHAVSLLGISDQYLQERAAQKREEMRTKRQRYGRPVPDFSGKTVLLVDDGIATGSSMLLAARALREAGAARVILAAPVAPAELLPALQKAADDVVIVHPSDNLIAVGRFYRDFHQLDDEEVVASLITQENNSQDSVL